MLPLDASSVSERALPLAASIAKRAGATLHVVSVAQPPDDPANTEEYVGQVVARIEAEYGCRVEATVQEGNVVERLLHEAGRCGADLTVMATHGRGGISRLWLGSVATRFLAETDKPLVLLRPAETEEASEAARSHFTKILVPLDGSPRAEECLTHASTLGGLFEASYHLTRVVRIPTEISSEYFEAERERALEYLDFHALRMRSEQRTVSTSAWLEQQPGRAIVSICTTEGCDSIAMATGGWDGLGRVLLGSTADKVLRGAEVPILLLGPRALGD
jgi:nucleotide-binding universal stress UspA family protein